MSHLRALLLTDVVDSTRLSLRVGDAEMADSGLRTTVPHAICWARLSRPRGVDVAIELSAEPASDLGMALARARVLIGPP